VRNSFPILWSAGYSGHVMTFEVRAVLEDAEWQAPLYCFSAAAGEEEERMSPPLEPVAGGASHGSFMRGPDISTV
jgi:hypothetical protein